MNHQQACEALDHILVNTGPMKGDVVALTGPWGCGKTHLWHTLKQQRNADDMIGNALYASVFGVNTVDEIRQRLLQSALMAADNKRWDAAAKVLNTVSKFHPSAEKILAALPHAISPFVIQKRLLVLDDIERKGSKLDPNALLGFVDEMKTRYDCRVLLVFNDAALGDALETWQQLREKVVDHEIVLAPSTRDSWTVAALATKFPSAASAERVLEAVAECGIINIRIMNKIAWVTIDLLQDYPELSDRAVRRIASTITVLTAVYYKGIPDAPSLRELHTDGTTGNTWQRFLKESNAGNRTNRGWLGIAHKLGVYGGGAFENAVINYLNTGWQKSEALSSAIKEIIRNTDRAEAADVLHQFLMDDYWDHALTTEERITMARRVAKRAHLLDYGAMSQFLCELDEIPDADDVAMSSFAVWKTAHRNAVLPVSAEDQFGRPLHRWMVEYLKSASPVPPAMDAFEALGRIIMNQIFYADVDALETLSADEYSNLIERAAPDELKAAFPGMWKLRAIIFADRDPSSSTAPDIFIDACRALCTKHPGTGLDRLIRHQLKSQGIPLLPDKADLPAVES